MKRFLIALIATLPLAIAAAEAAVVEYADGAVWVEAAGASATRVRADFGHVLQPGDAVVTGRDGIAIVRIDERSSVKLRENTRIVVEEAVAGSAVTLREGGLFARVARSGGAASAFQVRTPTVVAGVRGTEFFVAYGRAIEGDPDLWLCVNDGVVEVAVIGTDRSTLVREGEGVNILAGHRVTDPRFYAWTTDLNWNFDPLAGEVRDATNLDGAYADLLDQDYE